MRQDSGVDGDAQRISQLCWMFFLKIIDDQDQELELIKPAYRSPIPKRFNWRAWAADPEGMTGEELLGLRLADPRLGGTERALQAASSADRDDRDEEKGEPGNQLSEHLGTRVSTGMAQQSEHRDAVRHRQRDGLRPSLYR